MRFYKQFKVVVNGYGSPFYLRYLFPLKEGEVDHGFVQTSPDDWEYRSPATLTEFTAFWQDIAKTHGQPMRKREEVVNGVKCIVYYPNRTQRKHGVRCIG